MREASRLRAQQAIALHTGIRADRPPVWEKLATVPKTFSTATGTLVLNIDRQVAQGGEFLSWLLGIGISCQNHTFSTPSQKIEFWSERALQAGLSPLPSYTKPASAEYPLRFCQGRTLTAFHAFFDEGQALPTLAKANAEPQLWIHPQDAQKRHIASGTSIVIANQRGQFEASAHVTDDILPGVVWMRDGWNGVNRVTSGMPIVSPAASNIVPGAPGGQAAYDAWVEVCVKEG